jgi:hypothetical protein
MLRVVPEGSAKPLRAQEEFMKVLLPTLMVIVGLAPAAMVTLATTDIAIAQRGNIYQATLLSPG